MFTLTFSFAFALLGCNKETPQVTSDSKNDSNISCFSLCHETIQDKCMDTIVDYEANDVPVLTNETIYNPEYCTSECEANWTDEVMQCVHDIKSCEQLGPKADYCITNPPEDPFEYPQEKAENKNCDKACTNYADCAGMADDATETDIQEAYETCYSECQGWTEKTISCMANANGKTVNGCMTVSMCGLQQYQGVIDNMN